MLREFPRGCGILDGHGVALAEDAADERLASGLQPVLAYDDRAAGVCPGPIVHSADGDRMRIGVPKEIREGEKRVATTPEVVAQLSSLGFAVSVERGAGAEASFSDDAYERAGAQIADTTRGLWESSDIILKVRAPEMHHGLGVH